MDTHTDHPKTLINCLFSEGLAILLKFIHILYLILHFCLFFIRLINLFRSNPANRTTDEKSFICGGKK